MDKMKVLVVDDESRMRKLVSDFLTRKGYAVIEAADGVEAVDTFMENKDIALIILDVMMPRMDGWEVCRQIRKDSKVPIIMLTAKGEEMDELQGFECGADEYIAKPFSPKILTARVDAIIRRAYGVDSNEIIEIGGITIDKAAHIVKIDGEAIKNLNCLLISLRIKDLHCQERRFLTMYGIMITMVMQELLIPMLRS